MVNYREILRLNSLRYSQRQISASTTCSRDTIGDVCRLATKHGLVWPLPEEVFNQTIQDIFYPERKERTRRIPDYEHIHKELARPGVTLTLLWAEYTAMCCSSLQLLRVCRSVYRSWHRKLDQSAYPCIPIFRRSYAYSSAGQLEDWCYQKYKERASPKPQLPGTGGILRYSDYSNKSKVSKGLSSKSYYLQNHQTLLHL